MASFLSKLVPRSALVVLLMLTAGAIVAFAAVSHLVTRYNENQKARGRRLYGQAITELNAGNTKGALVELRAALICDPGNPQYQLSLGRALRDNGRLEEAQSYLLSLWERTPEDGTINLALARVAARRGSLDDAIRYYHNAMYGIWSSDPDVNRRNARIELIEFLLQKNALAQARAELLSLVAFLPPDPALRLRTAELLTQAQDYPDALAEYERVLKLDHRNPAALAGAGEVAYDAGRYRTAERYLQGAVVANPQDSKLRDLEASAKLILQADPFIGRISDAERNQRIITAFNRAGERLKTCAQQKGVDLSEVKPATSSASPAPPPAPLPSTSPLIVLESRWLATKPQLRRLRLPEETDLPDEIMDLVFDIEQQTATICGGPQGVDQALLLISRDRESADQ
jgi:tetratricopeptide (TPR) repeat protein